MIQYVLYLHTQMSCVRQLQAYVQMVQENVFIVLSFGDLGTKSTIIFFLIISHVFSYIAALLEYKHWEMKHYFCCAALSSIIALFYEK